MTEAEIAEFVNAMLAMSLCPRCFNLGHDVSLDLFDHCPRCDWQPEHKKEHP